MYLVSPLLFLHVERHVLCTLLLGPMHKRNFLLNSGNCLNDDRYSILAFDVKIEDDGSNDISVLLPEPEDLEQVIGTQRWIVRKDTAKVLDGDGHDIDGVEVVGPNGGECGSACGGKLDW